MPAAGAADDGAVEDDGPCAKTPPRQSGEAEAAPETMAPREAGGAGDGSMELPGTGPAKMTRPLDATDAPTPANEEDEEEGEGRPALPSNLPGEDDG